jgi:Mn-containing catalase
MADESTSRPTDKSHEGGRTTRAPASVLVIRFPLVAINGIKTFFHNEPLQYEVEVEQPDPEFAKMLQQAIGGAEGEMRVSLQYMFQAFGVPQDKSEYRQLLMETAAEELGRIEMLATAVSKNLQGAREHQVREARDDPVIDEMYNATS